MPVMFIVVTSTFKRTFEPCPIGALMLVAVTIAMPGASLPIQINRDPSTKTRRSLRRLVRSMLGVSVLIKTPPSALTLRH